MYHLQHFGMEMVVQKFGNFNHFCQVIFTKMTHLIPFGHNFLNWPEH